MRGHDTRARVVSSVGYRIAVISPDGFAAVMATGIVAIAALMLNEGTIAWPLAIANIALYLMMCIAIALRLAIAARSVAREFASFDWRQAHLRQCPPASN